jgi:hypothetical protein
MKKLIAFIVLLFLLLPIAVGPSAPFTSSLAFRGNVATAGGHLPDTLAWEADVVANGGTTPTEATLTAVDGWVTTVVPIKSKFIWVSFCAPDSLIAAKTPIYHTLGSDPATGTATLSGLNGLTTGAGLTIITGVNPAAAWTTSDTGLATYAASVNGGEVPRYTYGGGDASSCIMFWGHGNSYCIADTSPWINCPTASYTANSFGWISFQRTGASAYAIYAAQNSGYAWTTLNSGSTASGAIPTGTGNNSVGWQSAGVCAAESVGSVVSYLSVTHGMSSSDAQTEFNAAATLRASFGGGF